MSLSPNVPASARIMYRAGQLVLVGVALYFGFLGADTLGLPARTADARVVGKEYVPAGRTYTTNVVGGRSQVHAQTTPEMYVVHLEMAGDSATAAVEKSLYDGLSTGQTVNVEYRRRRVTGGTDVLRVSR